jgi:hypothetical protein
MRREHDDGGAFGLVRFLADRDGAQDRGIADVHAT